MFVIFKLFVVKLLSIVALFPTVNERTDKSVLIFGIKPNAEVILVPSEKLIIPTLLLFSLPVSPIEIPFVPDK